MPDGVMDWFDRTTGSGRVSKGGHRYSVGTLDVEPGARIAGARVHFDIDRHRPGVAVNVTRRRGHRSAPRHRRFGDLSGARRPDAKGSAPANPFEHPLVGRQAHPEHVVLAWAERVAAGDLAGAVDLYAPTAVIHTSEGDAVGRPALSDQLAAWPYTGANLEPIETVGDEQGSIRMTWSGWGPDRTTVLRLAHGEITEQWIGGAELRAPESAVEDLAVEVVAMGDVTDNAKAYAVGKVRAVAQHATGPVLFSRVRLLRLPDPAARHPAVAEALLDVNGRAVRAHVAADAMTEAIDLLAARLRERLSDQSPWSRREGVYPEPDEWRHANLPTRRPAWFERPPDEREIVRHKTIADAPRSVDEAVTDMELLDYDFYLFNDLATGQDAVVWRRGDGAIELIMLRPDDVERVASAAPVAVRPTGAPELTVDEAVEWLEVTTEPFVFFVDPEGRRGSVLYRRYDGHYGLLETVDLDSADGRSRRPDASAADAGVAPAR